jgi:hypothetical protein
MEYLRNFEISGYLLGAIFTGYIADRKIEEFFFQKCHCNTVNRNVCVKLHLILRNGFGNVK